MSLVRIFGSQLVNGEVPSHLLRPAHSFFNPLMARRYITRLDLSECTNLTTLPDKLPEGITSLDLSECRVIWGQYTN